jgi:hypothetical protein
VSFGKVDFTLSNTAFIDFSAACYASKQRSSQKASLGLGCLANAKFPFARLSHS